MTSIAIVGLYSEDFVTELFSDIEHSNNDIDLIAISDQDENLLLKYQKTWNIKKLYTDPRDLIITESPEIICVSLETDELIDIISLAIDKKTRGIILNRPITPSLETSQKIIDMCRLNNISLIINHKKRWDPLYLNVKEIINSQTLGELITISGDISNNTYILGDPQKTINKYGGGSLLYGGSDIIDLFRLFSGEVISVNGFLKRKDTTYGTETSSYSILKMHSGVTAYLKTNSKSVYDNFEIDLFFTEGRITIGKNIKDFYTISHSNGQSDKAELIKSEFPDLLKNKDFSSDAVNEMINSLNNHFLPESSGLNTIKNMEIVFAIYYSAYLSSNSVSLPIKIAGNPLQKMLQSGMI